MMLKVKLVFFFKKHVLTFFTFLVFGDMYVEYTVSFNKRSNQADDEDDSDKEDGPVVDRVCKKCGNTKMSYATLQLRSADEGQTVFFTCTKCNFKESENS